MIIKEPRGNMSGVYLVQPDDKNNAILDLYKSLLKHLLTVVCPSICTIDSWAVEGTSQEGSKAFPNTREDCIFICRYSVVSHRAAYPCVSDVLVKTK